MSNLLLLSSGPLFKAPLAQAFYEYGIKFVLLIIVAIVGVNLGRILREKKNKRKTKTVI